MKVTVLQDIMSANDRIASKNEDLLNKNNVLAVNVMSSPGAGKTSLILETIKKLKNQIKIAVIEADISSTIDAEKIIETGVPAVQINTGGECHTDANMFGTGIEQLSLKDIDLLLLENVGNLVCPAEFRIGAQRNVMLLSIPEGDDKPYKYPLMFTTVEVVIVSKMDYLPLSDFNLDQFEKAVKGINPDAHIFHVSIKNGTGIEEWTGWLKSQLRLI
ncbi:MAG: hydrogenase nickel incorporation protein HypB [Deltaproteobacteria bacterium]|nr:hydrogenase nickel incorporation protein HypB [Deltaproteobacteria bacterium]